eukprot:SAG31_NODE_4716_length_3011_cov_1.958791_3_plen_89_part_00
MNSECRLEAHHYAPPNHPTDTIFAKQILLAAGSFGAWHTNAGHTNALGPEWPHARSTRRPWRSAGAADVISLGFKSVLQFGTVHELCG